jgi:hypothetical protein
MAVFALRTTNVVNPIEGDPKVTVVIADNVTAARMIAGRADDIFLDESLSAVYPLGMSGQDVAPGIVARERY